MPEEAIGPEEYRDALEYLEAAIESVGRAAGAVYGDALQTTISVLCQPLMNAADALRMSLRGKFCKLCSHLVHANERCADRAPNPAFSCGCMGPCPHGRTQWYCKECRA